MKFARIFVVMMALAMPFFGNSGCSCDDKKVGDDLVFAYNPVSLDFGSVSLNQSKTLKLTVFHSGTSGTVVVNSIALEGVSSDEFSYSVIEGAAEEWASYSSISLDVGESAVISVTYTPKNSGTDNGRIVFAHNVATQGNKTSVNITTSGQTGELTAEPSPIDFGDINAGEEATLDVTITNNGTFTVDVTDVYLDYEGSFDFTVLDVTSKDGPTPVTAMAPGEVLNVTLQYKPVGTGYDGSNLIVLGNVEDNLRQWSFPVFGSEIGPRIQVIPQQIEFDFVPIDEERERSITVSNIGNTNLSITSVGTSMGSSPDLEIVNPPEVGAPVVIKPEQNYEFKVKWTAKTQSANPEAPIGAVTIVSNDLSNSPNVVPVYGQVEAPSIEVLPARIDFGFGAQNKAKSALLTIKNNGFGALTISKLEIINPSTTEYGQEFAITYNAGFPVTNSVNPAPSDIPGNSFTPVELTFTNKGPDEGEVTATLVIHSNSKGLERLEVPLQAKRSGAPYCRAQLVPGTVNFGVIAIGFPETKEARLVNTGTGDCTVTGFKLADCTSGMMGSSCPQPLTGSNSQFFKVVGESPMSAKIGGGSFRSIIIEFTPPTVTDIFNLLSQSSAIMSFKVKDDFNNQESVIPECSGTCNYNVVGQSGIAKAAVLPDHIDFGVVTIGCFSKTYSVCVYNSGNAPLKIKDLKFKGCTPEFHFKKVPALPKVVGTGAPVCFEANYSPLDEGVDQCAIHVSVTDKSAPIIAIPLKGEGTYETQHTDEFIQIKGDEVDILFVIDDSGSMCEEQSRLSASFGKFIAQASVWDNDYHIGVISVNVVDEPVIGRLNRGDKTVTPRYITKSGNAQSQFAKLVNIGCDGGSDAQEAGLQAAQTALAAPLTTDTQVTCGSNTDCTNDANICADPANCPYTCIDGSCGGFNKGFMREDAQLEIIILSDEEDQSSSSISFYVDFLTNIKGWANQGRMHVNAIVGVKGVPESSSEGACVASDGGTAAEGKRYIDACDMTGGQVGSICESSFAPIMEDIADITFNPKLQFFLSRLADPATVKVSVDHQGDGNFVPMSDCWEFDAPSNSVIFSNEPPCVPPQPQDHIKVSYKMLCLKG